LRLAVGNTFPTGGAPLFANITTERGGFESRHYTIKRGDELQDEIPRSEGKLHVHVHGPNGFYRRFQGVQIPVEVRVSYPKNRRGRPLGDIEFSINNISGQDLELSLTDAAYHQGVRRIKIKEGR